MRPSSAGFVLAEVAEMMPGARECVRQRVMEPVARDRNYERALRRMALEIAYLEADAPASAWRGLDSPEEARSAFAEGLGAYFYRSFRDHFAGRHEAAAGAKWAELTTADRKFWCDLAGYLVSTTIARLHVEPMAPDGVDAIRGAIADGRGLSPTEAALLLADRDHRKRLAEGARDALLRLPPAFLVAVAPPKSGSAEAAFWRARQETTRAFFDGEAGELQAAEVVERDALRAWLMAGGSDTRATYCLGCQRQCPHGTWDEARAAGWESVTGNGPDGMAVTCSDACRGETEMPER